MNKLRLLAFSTFCVFAALASSGYAQGKSISLRPATIRAIKQATVIVPQQIPAEGVVAGQDAAPVDPATAQREATKTSLLQQLKSLKLSRLPSEIMEARAKMASSSATKDADEPLPPAPASAFLFNPKRFEKVKQQFQLDFRLGDWDAVGQFINRLPEENRKALYTSILQALGQSTPLDELTRLRMQTQRRGTDIRSLEKQYLTYQDVFAIARIAPVDLEERQLTQLAQLVHSVMERGNTVEDFLELCKSDLEKNDQAVFSQRQIAKMLVMAQQPVEAGEFLPKLETAIAENDHEALNLLSVHLLSIHSRDNKVDDLEQAWKVTQAILSASEVDSEQRDQAIKRAVSLASRVRDDLGKKWLNDSFSGQPERGIEILSAIGTDTAKSMTQFPRAPSSRLKKLQIQNDAVNALLESAGDQAESWKETLNLLSLSWLREAVVCYTDDNSSTLNPNMQRDLYGNIFYLNNRRASVSSRETAPVSTGDLLEVRPSKRWLELLDPSLKPKFDAIYAQLYLKVGEENLAFPFIESLGSEYPDLAKDLIDEFLKVWTRNHDPNADRGRTNYYMFMYGFEQRAESIPLTRSKQERNLKELTELIPRLKALNLGEIDQELIAEAFTKCHSTAEVYQPEDIAAVFGSLDDVESEVLAGLARKMRTNLATLWRDASVQKNKKTKRRKKEMEAEVVRGYEVAKQLVADALANHPDSWALVNARAALMHDENNYKSELANNNSFALDRRAAMDQFKKAADLYVATVSELESDEYKTTVFENWFYATLGACDLNLIEETHSTDPTQPAAIREAILSMPADAADWHMSRFANLLFNRMSSAKSTLKFRYLNTGFEIVGDHKQARKAREVFDYYNDLVTEIKLVARIDGSDRVGHQSPFGLYVDIFHTQEIERESGGFGRYLQNQNSNMNFSYNYGRPTEDYRDKFEEHARKILSEQFEVLAVTFETPEVTSKSTQRDGWRRTPYAYLLLKPRGPEVDKIPSVKLDLDFLDTSGYAVLPVESEAIPIDALTDSPDPRPANVTEITQILDERQSDEGLLVLEVKAIANGLVPALETLFGDISIENFEVSDIEDQGVSVNKFDGDSVDASVISDRTWMVKLNAKSGLKSLPKEFEFPAISNDWESTTVNYQRYVDADLKSVENVVPLEEKYGQISRWQIILFSALGIVGLGILIFGFVFLSRTGKNEVQSTGLPTDLSPFNVITMLKDVEQNNGLSSAKKNELGQSINRLEAYYFGDSRTENETPDLEKIAKVWLSR